MCRQSFLITATIVLATCVIPAEASFTVYDEMLETMMDAANQEALILGHIAPPNTTSVINFSSNLDPLTGGFSFATLPGQTYMGQAILLSATGFYDIALRQAVWSTTGQFGADAWLSNGTAIWVGDPEGETELTVTLGGKEYKVKAKLKYEVSPFGLGKSTGEYTFTGPADGPGGPGPFGPYPGTDEFLEGKWRHQIYVPRNPVTPDGIVIASLGEVPFPGGGLGGFEVAIAPVPEPTSLALAGVGSGLCFIFGRKRRRTIPTEHPAND